MFNKIKEWCKANKEAVLVGAMCGVSCLIGEAVGVYYGKRQMAGMIRNACHTNQSFSFEAPREGVRYLINLGTEKLG